MVKYLMLSESQSLIQICSSKLETLTQKNPSDITNNKLILKSISNQTYCENLGSHCVVR